MEFLELLKRLNASEQSIRKTVAFALQYATRCPDDIWDCVMTECAKAPSNTRINVLFMLDSFLADDFETSPAEVAVYRTLAVRDLPAIIDMVVPPDSWDAVLNITSTRQVCVSLTQILASWESKRIFDLSLLTSLMTSVEQRAASVRDRAQHGDMGDIARVSRSDVLRRIEEDRERVSFVAHLSTNDFVKTAGNCHLCRTCRRSIYPTIGQIWIPKPILSMPSRWNSSSSGIQPVI